MDASLTGLVLQDTALGALTAVASDWTALGAEISVKGSRVVLVPLTIDVKDSTVYNLRVLLRRASAGDSFAEQAADETTIPDGILTYVDRVHKLNPDATTGTCYAVLDVTGFDYAQVQVKFTTPGGTAGDVSSAFLRPVAEGDC